MRPTAKDIYDKRNPTDAQRLLNEIDGQLLAGRDPAVIGITYRKQTSESVTRLHSESPQGANVDDVFPQARCAELFADDAVHEVTADVARRGFLWRYRPYSEMRGIIGCDLEVRVP